MRGPMKRLCIVLTIVLPFGSNDQAHRTQITFAAQPTSLRRFSAAAMLDRVKL